MKSLFTRSAEKQTAILAASRAINSTPNLDDALRAVIRSAKELSGADEASVMLLRDGVLKVRVAEGLPPAAMVEAVAVGRGVSGRVAMTGAPALISGKAPESDFSHLIESSRELRSSMCLPLKTAGTIVGVLNLNLTSGNKTFRQRDLADALIFAEQAAAAIYKSTLLEAATLRSQDLAFLLEAGATLVGTLDLDLMLTRVLSTCLRIAQSEIGFIVLTDLSTGRERGLVAEGVVEEGVRAFLTGHETFVKKAPAGQIAVSDIDGLGALARDNATAMLVPIDAEAGSRAIVVAFIPEGRDGKVEALLATFAQHAALAIRNAQLVHITEESRGELASVLTSISEPIVVLDSMGCLMLANPAAQETFGFSIDYARGHEFAQVVQDTSVASIVEHDGGDIMAGTPPVLYQARASFLRGEGAASIGKTLVFHDMSKERAAAQAKEDFIAVMSHELRTPLSLIKGYLKAVLDRGEKMTKQQRHASLETALESSSELEGLVENLLLIGSLNRAGVQVELEDVELRPLVERVLDEFALRLESRDVFVECPEDAAVQADERLLGQVLRQLIDNVCKYAPESPMRISVDVRDDETEVAVSDEGPGIVPGEVPFLFERFKQLDSSPSRPAGGTGVGLYICRNILNAHNGRIWCDAGLRRGATFRFTIPLLTKRVD